MTRLRFLAAVGAGGVVFMTPMVFHAINFSASEVGRGLALSAVVGTVVRLISGALLDRGLRCSWPVRATAILALLADIVLFRANSYSSFMAGEILIGSAAGLYWPAIELAVPLSCESIPSSRGYALVRSADALGFGLGALLGTAAAAMGTLRLVYVIEAICMIGVLVLVSLRPLLDDRRVSPKQGSQDHACEPQHARPVPFLMAGDFNWLISLLPVLGISVVATGILALEQSALSIDLVRGGLERPGLSDSQSGGLIALQLLLLVLLQWPVGRWLAHHTVRFGLGLSLISFSLACLLLALSSLTRVGTILVIAALLPMALAQAAFLPTAAEAVIEETPLQHRGLAMALFSQCFALSAIVAPLLGGALLDRQGHGLLLWTLMSVTCLMVLPTALRLQPCTADASTSTSHSEEASRSGSDEQLIDAVTRGPGRAL